MSNLDNSLSQGLGSILNGISGFFHIFDLPFFVSGIVISSSVAIFTVNTENYSALTIPFPEWVSGIIFLVITYVFGLIAFALGRKINDICFRKDTLKAGFQRLLESHHLTELETVKKYSETDSHWHLYARFWQELVHYKENKIALKHITRYWALAALFDSLATSFLIVALLFVASSCPLILEPLIKYYVSIPLAILSFLISVLCLWQGAKFFEYQIVDLIATIATAKSHLIE